MIMITVISSYLEGTRTLIEGLGIRGFTQISELKGAGRRGKRMDSPVFPGTSSMLLTVVGDEEARQLMENLGDYSSSLPEKDALRAFQLQVEASI